MALKRYVHQAMMTVTCYCYRDPKRKKDAEDLPSVSVELRSISGVSERQKDAVVMVVLAGGTVELYAGAITASLVMEKYPGLCVARPQVFKRPHESLVGPTERLLPGEKFYLVPRSTVKKLCRNVANKIGGDGGLGIGGVAPAKAEEGEEGGGGDSDEPVCSAKDFYVSRDRWTQSFLKTFGRAAEEEQQLLQQQQQQRRHSTWCNKGRRQHGLLLGWKPSLASIKELSP